MNVPYRPETPAKKFLFKMALGSSIWVHFTFPPLDSSQQLCKQLDVVDEIVFLISREQNVTA